MKNTEQGEQHSSEDAVSKYTAMPDVKEFNSLPSDVKEKLVDRFANEEQAESHSDTPVEKPTEQVDNSQKKGDNSEPKVEKAEDKQEDKEDGESIPASRYKDLQREFSRRNEELKELRNQKDELLERVVKLETKAPQAQDNTASQDDEALASLKKLAEDNPKVAPLVQALENAINAKAAKLEAKYNELTEKEKLREQSKSSEIENSNLTKFSESLTEFLDSPLKGLEPEFEAIIAEKYGDAKALELAARRDPELFESLKGKLFSKHFAKVREALDKADDEKGEDPKKRHEEIKNTGVSGPSNTHLKDVSDKLDMKNFKSLSTAEKEKLLTQQGRVED